jgi:hypothetical protein
MEKLIRKVGKFVGSEKKHFPGRRQFILSSVAGLAQAYAAVRPRAEMQIAHPQDAGPLEILAARELCRYLYLRTGKLLRIVPLSALPRDFRGYLVSEKTRALLTTSLDDPDLQKTLRGLEAQQFLLRKIAGDRREFVLVAGGDAAGTLYAAYRLAERYDVRFYLHGDSLPDRQISLELPDVNELGKPRFELRGVNPWGSHVEGMDLWNAADYQALLAQLAKMRMNFIGMHGYPELKWENGTFGAEPTVWTGLPKDVGAQGQVNFSYPASYFNTLRQGWFGYREAKKTSEYCYGAACLFDRDNWGPEVMTGHCPQPVTPDDCNEVFNRTGAMFREAFSFARTLGVKTCLGTETPLIIPRRVKEELEAAGRDPSDARVIQEIYEGTFRRIMQAHPLDYYWVWTPEGWEWSGVSDETVRKTIDDIKLAITAAQKVRAPFRLATAGWVLGPPQDRTLFAQALPPEVAVSELAPLTGKGPIDPNFAKISGRAKWAIPWMEDDSALTSPQLWVGRVYKDASDALAYGCTGLMGLHWRTRILGPNLSALAQTAWNQGWSPPLRASREAQEGPVGGRIRRSTTPAGANPDQAAIYQTLRSGMEVYRLKVPAGTYRVTLKFFEPDYDQAGKRVFDVKLQGSTRIEKLDLAQVAGRQVPHDEIVDAVTVRDGWLAIEFVPHTGRPVISAIVVESSGYARKVNCGGPAYQDYRADWPDPGEAPDRYLPSGAFYDDWARIEFGPEVAAPAAAIFKSIDCHLPVTSKWLGGAGDIAPDERPWDEVAPEFAFVASLERLRPEVRGAGQRERFDYWLNTFRYMRSQAQVRCLLAEFERVMKRAQARENQDLRRSVAREEALPAYRRLLAGIGEACGYLLSTVSTMGCIGTVINWQQKIWPALVEKTGQELSQALGVELPSDVAPSREFRGAPRIIVPTLRSVLEAGEELSLKAILLDQQPPRQFTLHYRPLGRGRFAARELTHVARGVYRVQITAPKPEVAAWEYFLRAETSAGQSLIFPATAPTINQTVVIVPKG